MSGVSEGNVFKMCQDFKNNNSHVQGDINAVVKFLTSISKIFNEITKDQLGEIAKRLRPYSFHPGEHLIREGDDGNFLVILFTGRVNIHRSKGIHTDSLKEKIKAKKLGKKINKLITSTFTYSEDEDDEAVINPGAKIIAVREGPDMLGEAALKKNEKRVCDVVAHSYCQCLLLYKEDYEKALENYSLNKQNENKMLLR